MGRHIYVTLSGDTQLSVDTLITVDKVTCKYTDAPLAVVKDNKYLTNDE